MEKDNETESLAALTIASTLPIGKRWFAKMVPHRKLFDDRGAGGGVSKPPRDEFPQLQCNHCIKSKKIRLSADTTCARETCYFANPRLREPRPNDSSTKYPARIIIRVNSIFAVRPPTTMTASGSCIFAPRPNPS